MVGVLDSSSKASHQARLQRIVLSWDYLQILSDAKAKADRKKSANGGATTALRSVPPSFADMDEYRSVFEPLLLEECRAQILRGDEESGLECHVGACTKCERANEFHFATITAQPHLVASFNENDLLLVSREKPLGGAAPLSSYALANVETRESQTCIRVRMCLGDEGESEPRPGWTPKDSARCARLLNHLTASSAAPCWMLNLCNLATLTREYAALRAAASLPFAATLLNKSSEEEVSETGQRQISQPLLDCLLTNHNASQMGAIQACLMPTPVVLIQGPPGTGKTQTILGVLSTLLHSRLESAMSSGSRGGGTQWEERPEMDSWQRRSRWQAASPWLGGAGGNLRDSSMPTEGDVEDFFGGAHCVEQLGGRKSERAHVLVCAPSNSALDEIVLRLINSGLRDEAGLLYSPSVVRVGLTPHASVESVSMDALVAHRLSSMERSAASAGARAGSAGMERDRVRVSILDEAQIVCSTLAFSGSGAFARMSREFDTVVIDEAAQAVEPSTLVPLCHGCRQVVLVGDPLQLPATVLSPSAVAAGYALSLFQRLQGAGYPVHMLRTQYRMHSQIRHFPSANFYDNQVVDGEGVDTVTARAWHAKRIFGPFFFFDLEHGEETQPGGSTGSRVNIREAEFVVQLYRQLSAWHPELKNTRRVGIISPYKFQVKLIREKLKESGQEGTQLVDVNTVDGFQGREKDVVIFSCVRANATGGIGFLADYRRMNVALTRARASMLVVGRAKALQQDKHWRNLVKHAKAKERFMTVPRPTHKLFSPAMMEKMERVTREENEAEGASVAEAAAQSPQAPSEGANGTLPGGISEVARVVKVREDRDEDEDEDEDEGMEEDEGGMGAWADEGGLGEGDGGEE